MLLVAYCLLLLLLLLLLLVVAVVGCWLLLVVVVAVVAAAVVIARFCWLLALRRILVTGCLKMQRLCLTLAIGPVPYSMDYMLPCVFCSCWLIHLMDVMCVCVLSVSALFDTCTFCASSFARQWCQVASLLLLSCFLVEAFKPG